jgi:hypothetical protein
LFTKTIIATANWRFAAQQGVDLKSKLSGLKLNVGRGAVFYTAPRAELQLLATIKAFNHRFTPRPEIGAGADGRGLASFASFAS